MKRTVYLVATPSLRMSLLFLGVRSAARLMVVILLVAFVSDLSAQSARRFTEKELEEFDLQRIKRKIPQPQTLDNFICQVQGLKDLGADNAEIAEHMSNVVDKRLKADNRPWDESLDVAAMRTMGVRSIGPIKELLEEYKQRWAPLDALRNTAVQVTEPHPVDDGRLYAATAPPAWENRVGNCSESASVAYSVLKDVGIPARIFASCAGGGHEFVVIGLAPNFDPNNPDSWGPDARVVDGWTGHTLTREQAFANAHFFGGRTVNGEGGPMVIDCTDKYDNPGQHEKWEALGSKGIVEVTVVGESDKKVVPGATVRLKVQEEQTAVTTGQGFVRFTCYPGPGVPVEVEPPKESGLAPASESVTVRTKWVIPVTITLKMADKNWLPGNWEETSEQSGKKRTITLSRQGGTVQVVAGNKTYTGTDQGGVLKLTFQYSDQSQLIIKDGPEIPAEVRQQIVDRKPKNSYEMKVVSPTQMEGTKSDSWFFQWEPPTKKLYTLQLDPSERVVWKKVP